MIISENINYYMDVQPNGLIFRVSFYMAKIYKKKSLESIS